MGELPFLLFALLLIVYAWMRTKEKGTREFAEKSFLLLAVASLMYAFVRYFGSSLASAQIQGIQLELALSTLSVISTTIVWLILTKAVWRAKVEKDLGEAVIQAQSAAESLSKAAGRVEVATSRIEQSKRDFEQSKRDFRREIEAEVFGELDKVRATAPELSDGEINKIVGGVRASLTNAIPKRDLDDDEIGKIAERLGAVIKGSVSQKEGLDYQQASAYHLESLSFGVKNSAGREQPDHLLYVGRKLVAVGSAKCCTIKTSWTLNEERAGRREVSVAKEKGLPLYISIYNKTTNRIWSLVIEPRSLENLTLTAPSWLWKKELSAIDQAEMEKNHQETGRQLLKILEAARGRTRTLRVSPKTLRKSTS